MENIKPIEKVNEQNDENTIVKTPFKVILFNDDEHTFDEVIVQLIKAIQCSYEKARDYAFETHVNGKAVVYNGELQKCLKVSSILEEISLRTQIVS